MGASLPTVSLSHTGLLWHPPSFGCSQTLAGLIRRPEAEGNFCDCGSKDSMMRAGLSGSPTGSAIPLQKFPGHGFLQSLCALTLMGVTLLIMGLCQWNPQQMEEPPHVATKHARVQRRVGGSLLEPGQRANRAGNQKAELPCRTGPVCVCLWHMRGSACPWAGCKEALSVQKTWPTRSTSIGTLLGPSPVITWIPDSAPPMGRASRAWHSAACELPGREEELNGRRNKSETIRISASLSW